MAIKRWFGRRRDEKTSGVTAAATEIKFDDDADAKAHRRRPAEWQRSAWRYYDELGEVRFANRYMGDAMSRLRIYPAIQPDPEAPPTSILDKNLDAAIRPSETDVASAVAITRRLQSPEGGQSEILRGLATNVFQVGEVFLVGRDVDGVEQWEAFSSEELVVKTDGRYALKPTPDTPDHAAVDLPANSVGYRIWRRHPRWSAWPDCAMRACLTICDELQILTQMIRSTALSRIPAGIFALPNSANDGGPQGDVTKEGDPGENPLGEKILKHFVTPIENPGSAAAVSPFILFAEAEDLEHAKKIDFARDFDTTAASQRLELIQRLATSLDLPAEVLTGKADLNHWTAWQVDEEAFNAHIAPFAVMILDALTTGYLRPQLAMMGVEEPSRYRFWFDPSDLITRANSADEGFELYDRYELSGDALRSRTGTPDTDKPQPEEIAARLEREKTVRSTGVPPALGGPPTNGTTPAPNGDRPADAPRAAPDPDGDRTGVAAVLAPARAVPALGELAVPRALVAAAPGAPIGAEWLSIERTLRLRIQQAADEMTRRALDRAGSRLRSRASHRSQGDALRSRIDGLPTEDVAAALGPELVMALNTTPDDLLDGAFGRLEDRYRTWVRRAQTEGNAAVARAADVPPEDRGAVEAEQEHDRDEGWATLETALYANAAARLYDPTPEPPVAGEFDDTTLVPAGIVRESLSVAGGARDLNPSPTARVAPSGLFDGRTTIRLLDSAGLQIGGYVWVYGDPSSRRAPFDPHLDLAGVEFNSWTDPVLENVGDWPEEAYYFPGDHLYCQCDYLRQVGPPASAET